MKICTFANRRHAIIAGFSFPEALLSRRKFIFSGENSVRFAATSHGGKPLPAMLERRPYNTTTRFDGMTFYISGQTGMPKTDQSRHNKKQFLIWP